MATNTKPTTSHPQSRAGLVQTDSDRPRRSLRDLAWDLIRRPHPDLARSREARIPVGGHGLEAASGISPFLCRLKS
jgi:hypothetical protein